MQADDDALAGIDLAAWQPPAPPAGLADAVLARIREPVAVAPVDPRDPASRRAWWIAGTVIAAAATVALVAWTALRAPRSDRGEAGASRALHLALDGTTADLDPGARVRWERDGHRLTAHQSRGTVRWTVADEDTLVIDPGGPGATTTIEAAGASLRVEVQVNLSDVRMLGMTTLTAATVAVVTAAVYQGQVKATSAGQTVAIAPGATVDLRTSAPPQDRAETAPDPPPPTLAVAATATADVKQLEDRLRAADEKIAALTADLAARTVRRDPPPASAENTRPPQRTAPNHPAAPTPDPTEATCARIDVEEWITRAANQYSAGYAKAALFALTKALACKQDVRMYRMAAMYACAARDPATAKQMIDKVPAAFRPALVQRCQTEGIDILRP